MILESNNSSTEQINESTSIVDNKLSVCKVEPKIDDVSSIEIHDGIAARHDILGNSPVHRKCYAAIVMS